MKRLPVALLVVVVLAWATPAQAQLLFRKPRPNASQRVPELILTLKTDADERKRLHAVEELREFDSAAYNEIVPVLVDALQNDKKMSVRAEAATSLARIRPIHPLAGPALEKAAQSDESWRVRFQAKSALTKLNLVGLVTKKQEPTTARKGEEPPINDAPLPNPLLLDPLPMVPAIPVAVSPVTVPQSSPSAPGMTIPRPLPRGTTAPPVVIPAQRQPTAPPTPTRAPSEAPPPRQPDPQGPSLFP